MHRCISVVQETSPGEITITCGTSKLPLTKFVGPSGFCTEGTEHAQLVESRLAQLARLIASLPIEPVKIATRKK
jgi:hypothetical protein